jgi:hypothetical protein
MIWIAVYLPQNWRRISGAMKLKDLMNLLIIPQDM